ncbi:SWIM zinc finger family protein [Streptomyces sp. NPDC051555]|uniref:SWIM zinc finger family protein n=1 Tax=Streptomyces sp. NPDC051555 TaxID=3365657 RepID=UPI0037AD2EDE
MSALEGPDRYGYARADGRLSRGRTYARSGAVGTITVRPGSLTAPVHGSRRTPYRTKATLPELHAAAWNRLLEAIARKPAHIAALLDRTVPEEIDAVGRAADTELLPRSGQFTYHCSCPDWGDPCKHAAALCYQFGRVLDTTPFALFLLRGRDEVQLLDELAARSAEHSARTQPAPPAPRPSRGVRAAAAFARAHDGPLPPPPPLPDPDPHPGPVTDLTGTEEPGPAIVPHALQSLAADAARRALAAYTRTLAEPPAGEACALPSLPGLPDRAARLADDLLIPSLTAWQDLARRASAEPDREILALLLVAAQEHDPTRLTRAAHAWRYGGPPALATLGEGPPPTPQDVTAARTRIAETWEGGRPPALRRTRDRWTVVGRDAQLRWGPDGRWYPYRRSEGLWWPAGPGGHDAGRVLASLLTSPPTESASGTVWAVSTR